MHSKMVSGAALPACLFALAVLLTPATQAQAGNAATSFVVDPPTIVPLGPISAKKGDDLMTLAGRASRAVRLEDAVRPEDAVDAQVAKDYPLKAGQILLGSNERPGIYCAPIAPRGLGQTGPCLIDADLDGIFDSISLASFSGGGEIVLITTKSKFMPADLKRNRPLTSQVRYAEASYADGQRGNLRLSWESTYKPNKPGRAVEILFWLDGSAGFTGTHVVSRAVRVIYAGTPVEVKVEGISLRVQGFGADGAIQCELLDVERQRYVVFETRGRPNVMYIYIP